MEGALIGALVAFCVVVFLILYGATKDADDFDSDTKALERTIEWNHTSAEEKKLYHLWCKSSQRDPLDPKSWDTWKGVRRSVDDE